MNKTTINWPGLTHTSNPGYGCLRECEYCYACDLHNKRMKAKKNGKKLHRQYDKPFNVMQYFPERLNYPKNPKKPTKVFIGSCSDICYWANDFIRKTIIYCQSRPNVEFMFCTKDPLFYKRWYFPKNCWLGATITGDEKQNVQFDKIIIIGNISVCSNRTFLSIEPILGEFYMKIPDVIDLVIVGADSRKGAAAPEKSWIESIKHPNIHWKSNIKKYL